MNRGESCRLACASMAFLWLVASLTGCGGSETGAAGEAPAGAAGAAAVPGSGGGSGAATGGAASAGSAGNGGTPGAAGSAGVPGAAGSAGVPGAAGSSGGAGGGAAGAGSSGAAGSGGAVGGTIEPGALVKPGRSATEFVLDPGLHPHQVALTVRVFLPDGEGLLGGGKVYPVAFGYHGSGGLHVEPAAPGDECTQTLDPKYQQMTDFFLSRGIAAVWVDSFYSRDPRFCEDNSPDFQQFAPPVMDNDLQQVVSRVYDTVIAETAFCSMNRFDCGRMLRIGTSEGGTAALLPSHRFLDHTIAQLFDPDNPKNKLGKLPLLTYAALPADRPRPSFILPISPGCGFYSAIPFAIDGATEDLFYPEQHAYIEIGSEDSIPAECSVAIGMGRRELQAKEVQKREAIAEMRYHTTIHPGAGHPLWEQQQASLEARLAALIEQHFAP